MANTIEFLIKADAQLAGLQQTVKSLDQVREKAASAGLSTTALDKELKLTKAAEGARYLELYSKGLQNLIQAEKAAGRQTGDLEKQLAALSQTKAPEVPKTLGFFEKLRANASQAVSGIPVIGGLLTGSAGMALGGAGAAVGVAKHGLSEYMGKETAATALDAALGQSGQLTDRYREKLQAMAGELSATTSIAEHEWLSVLTRLTQFGANDQTMGVNVEAVKNLAGLMGGNLPEAAMVWSKAMQGNYELLHRYGISVTEGASLTQKLEEAMKQLAARGGGQLEAQSKTLSGQFRALKLAMGEVFSDIGQGISDTGILQKTLYGLTSTSRWLAEVFGGATTRVKGMGNAALSTVDQVAQADEANRAYAKSMESLKIGAAEATTELERQLAAMREIKGLQDAVTNANLALTKSELALQAKKEGWSPEKLKLAESHAETQAKEDVYKRDQNLAEETKTKVAGHLTGQQDQLNEATARQYEAMSKKKSKQQWEDERIALAAEQQNPINYWKAQLAGYSPAVGKRELGVAPTNPWEAEKQKDQIRSIIRNFESARNQKLAAFDKNRPAAEAENQKVIEDAQGEMAKLIPEIGDSQAKLESLNREVQNRFVVRERERRTEVNQRRLLGEEPPPPPPNNGMIPGRAGPITSPMPLGEAGMQAMHLTPGDMLQQIHWSSSAPALVLDDEKQQPAKAKPAKVETEEEIQAYEDRELRMGAFEKANQPVMGKPAKTRAPRVETEEEIQAYEDRELRLGAFEKANHPIQPQMTQISQNESSLSVPSVSSVASNAPAPVVVPPPPATAAPIQPQMAQISQNESSSSVPSVSSVAKEPSEPPPSIYPAPGTLDLGDLVSGLSNQELKIALPADQKALMELQIKLLGDMVKLLQPNPSTLGEPVLMNK